MPLPSNYPSIEQSLEPAPSPVVSLPGNWFISLFLRDQSRHLIHFSRNVATMLQAGLPLEQILHRQQRYISHGPLRNALAQIYQAVSSGMSFSDALAKHPKLFDEFYRSIITVGEESGQLDMAMREVADALERFLVLRRKVIAALVYPVFVIGVALFDALLFLSLIIPYILNLSESMLGKPEGLLLIVNTVAHFWWVLVVLLGALIAGIVGFFQTKPGREILDELVLYVPLLNETIQVVQCSYFITGLGLGYQAGLPLEHAVRLGVDAIPNLSVKSMFAGVAERLQAGTALSEALADVGYLPGMVQEMVDTGEISGMLQSMLGTASEYLEQEIDARLQLFMALLKPLLLVMVALIIGSVILLIYTSVFATVGGIMQQATQH